MFQINSPKITQEIITLALEYRALRSIDKKFLSLLFSVSKKGVKEKIYCFAREKSDTYSFNVCIGQQALFTSLKSFAPIKRPPVDSMYDINAISIGFLKNSEKTQTDLSIIKELGIKVNLKKPIPYIRKFSPGLQPWFPDKGQLEILLYTLQITIELLKGDYIDSERVRQGMVPHIETINGKTDQFKVTYDHLVLKSPYYTVVTPENGEFATELKRLCKRKGRILAGIYYYPLPSSFDKKGRAVFPLIYMLADHKTGEMLHCDDFENIKKDGYKIIDSLLNIIITKQELPRTITVRNDETFYLLKDTCELLDIKLKIQPKLEILDAFWHTLYTELQN